MLEPEALKTVHDQVLEATPALKETLQAQKASGEEAQSLARENEKLREQLEERTAVAETLHTPQRSRGKDRNR